MSDQDARPLVDNDTVWAFLDGDGADPEAFENLRRHITRAVPYILDSEVGRDYAVAKLAEAEKRGAVKALRGLADECIAVAAGEPSSNQFEDLSRRASWLRYRADRIESGQVTLP